MAGEGSRPLPIRPRRSVAGSLQSGISSGSAASKGTLVATSVPGMLTNLDVSTTALVNLALRKVVLIMCQ